MRLGVHRDYEFSCRHVEFRLSLTYPEGDVEEAIGYTDLELRDESWAGDIQLWMITPNKGI